MCIRDSDRSVRLWNTESGQCVQNLQGHTDAVTCFSFSRDNKFLVSGSYDKSVRLWNIESGQCVRNLQGHTADVKSVSFSRDGKLVASGSCDKSVLLWSIESGQCVQNLQGHTKIVTSVSFSGDGKLLASGSYDETVWLWDIQSGQEVTKDTPEQGLQRCVVHAIFSQTRHLSIKQVNISGAVGLSSSNNRLLKQSNCIQSSCY
eukprot:TRINITY_DN5124_c0_g1_i5.p1 TRINITY_DN5124_c0_g1~~TRINITY_DN5124_c0_g1_i5.p1  ORF type:complete len:204 (+),score=17.85 TRINITY_DN5124_c0_g1_i5:37-648(+)